VVKTATILGLVLGQPSRKPVLVKDILARLNSFRVATPRSALCQIEIARSLPRPPEVDLFGRERHVSPVESQRRLGGFEFANDGTLSLGEIEALAPSPAHRLLM
jgi:DNA-binding NtrC family response regulator